MQQMQAQLALAQQWVAQQQAVGAKSNTREASKKQREIYVGNLAMNVVTPEILAEVFNSALLSLSKDGRTPVVHCNMAHDGKFAFVELRTEEISDAAQHLDGVELCGRPMKVGRPKGWVDQRTPEQIGAAKEAAQRRAPDGACCLFPFFLCFL